MAPPADDTVPPGGRDDRSRRGESRVVAPHVGLPTRLARLWRSRELLVGMVRKELKVKYKNSVLGFAWSLLNPLLYLAVFYVAFQLILRASIPSFPIFLLSGLLVWNLFSSGVAEATSSVVANAGIVTKVSFPREVLPLASVGAALVHFVLQVGVFALVLLVVRHDVAWSYVPLLPVALVVLLLLSAGLGLLFGALNVYARDAEHLVELGLLAWFWLTPIVYSVQLLADRVEWARTLYFANPVTPVVVVFQRALYNTVTVSRGPVEEPGVGPQSLERLREITEILPDWGVGGYAAYLGVGAASAVVAFVVGMWAFGRLEGDFAEEL